MEHWQKILVGFVYSILFTALLYPLFRWFLQTKNGQRGRDYDNRSRVAPAAAWPMKVKSVFRGAQNIYNLKSNLNVDKSKLSDEEETDTHEESRLLHQQQQNLIYDEYESFNHNCLVMIANNETKCVGICLFLLDRKVEYYVEDISPEIQSEIKSSSRTNEEEVLSRGLKTTLHGISQWSDQWCAAESVNLLLKDKDVVLKLNSDPDIEEAAKTVSDLALLNGFKIYCQWSDNFICDTVSFTCLFYFISKSVPATNMCQITI